MRHSAAKIKEYRQSCMDIKSINLIIIISPSILRSPRLSIEDFLRSTQPAKTLMMAEALMMTHVVDSTINREHVVADVYVVTGH